MSERVLYEWTTDSGRRLSILDESDVFGKGEVGIGVDGEIDSSLGWGLALARELARLAARVSELELDREGRIRSSDYDKALIEKLEDENERLRDEVDRQTKAKECYEERQARKEAENTKLRKCVKAGDAFRIKVQAAENYCVVSGIYSLAALHGIRYEGPVWKGELEDYLAARAEVDK